MAKSNPRTKYLNDFREIDGTENNLENSIYDLSAGYGEIRLTEPHFAEGTTNGLIIGPDPRTISNVLAGGDRAEVQDTTSGISGFSYAVGQFLDHDISRTPTGGADISMFLSGDPLFPDGTRIPMSRGQVDANGNPVNAVTGWLDLSQVYGSDAETNASLRTSGGYMKTSDGNQLPVDAEGDDYLAGDIRVMENPQLTGITLVFVREHNFHANRLNLEHPEWSDEQVYQMAKAITTAEWQNIIYNEYLPSIIGDVIPAYTGYNPNVDPRILNDFSNAAFRFGHSSLSDEQAKLDEFGNVLENQTLAQARQNGVAEQIVNGGLDAVMRGLAADGANLVDTGAVDGVRNATGGPNVFDLIAIDIQRQRDLGVGTLNQTREALGLTPYASFEEVTSDASLAADLHTLYDPFGGIEALDLFMGGLAEDHAQGSTMGETFTTIIALQFTNLRDGDRYYWENQNFDANTQALIASATWSDLIIRNTDTDNLQANAFFEAERRASDVAAANPDIPQLVIGIDVDGINIAGGPNNDTLVLGNGANQTMTGNGGDDTFVINDWNHSATITDFETSFEQIQFQGDAPTGLTAQIKNGANGAELYFNGNTITLAGVDASTVSQGNLTFLDSNAIATSHKLV